MKKTGELLKAEREKRNLSLHEIGMSLKINPKILKTIEEGDVKNLPAKTFLRGFVRSYAQYLRLDVDEVLRIFLEEMGPTRPEANKPLDGTAGSGTPGSEIADGAPPAEPRSVSPSIERTAAKEPGVIDNMTGSNRFFMIVGGVFLLVVIIFVVKMLNKYQKESQTERPTVSVEETTPEVTADKSGAAIHDGVGKEGANTIANGFASTSSTTTTIGMSASGKTTLTPVTTLAPATTTTTTTVKAHAPTTTTTPPSTQVPKPIVTTTTVIVPTTTLQVPPVTTTSLPPGASTTTTTKPPRAVEVIVEALNHVSIKAQLYNGKTETLELDADQVHTFKSKAPIVLEFSDGGAVSLIVNGKDREVPGTIGKPLKIKLP